jgi:hypothetical protein
VEREYGHGGTSALRRPEARRRADDGALPGVRHLAQDRAQALRPLQGARAGGARRPAAATGAGGEPAADADRGGDRRAPARASELGRTQAARAARAPAGAGRAGAGALDDPCGARPPRPGRARACPPPAGQRHAAVGGRGSERSLVRGLQRRVPPRQRQALLPAHRHRPDCTLHPHGRGAGGDSGSPRLHRIPSAVRGARPAGRDPLRQWCAVREQEPLRSLEALGLVAAARHRDRAHLPRQAARDTVGTSACTSR